jgi:PhzF family phenazine biosynthesis protein
MDTRQVLLADAFASEPLGGLAVVVVPDGDRLADAQLRRIAGEVGAAGVATLRNGGLTYVARRGVDGVVAGAVAGGGALLERGHLDAGSHGMTIERASHGTGERASDSGPAELAVEVEADGSVDVPLPDQPGEPATASTDDLAAALGIDVAAIDDVSADLPPARIGACGGTLLTPVNFLQHLSRADPAPGDLAALLDGEGAVRLCAFTFDTLNADAALHARFFDPAADGCEQPASGVAVGACGAHLSRHAVFDGNRDAVRVECGRFLDRPGAVTTTLAGQPRVGGNALTVLDGNLGLPPDDDDEILEL